MEVLPLIAEGKANTRIAETLAISIKTVLKHRARLRHKLDIYDTAALPATLLRRASLKAVSS